jgi:effector-binding domain-containing protein
MKKLLRIVLGILLLYMVLALFGPKHIDLQRSISIDRNLELIRPELEDYKAFHDHWSPWTAKDTAMEVNYTGTPGLAGHKYTWKGNSEVGEGSMEIVGWNGDSLIERLGFGGNANTKAYYVLTEEKTGSQLVWGISMDIGFFMRPILLFVPMEKFLGKDFETGLENLKKVVEAKPKDALVYKIETLEWPAVTYAGKKETVMFADLSSFFGKHYVNIMKDPAVTSQSAPTAIFINYDAAAGKTEVMACVQVPHGRQFEKWDTANYPASKVFKIAYYGAYDKIGKAHDQLGKYFANHQLKNRAVMEEYVTDPSKEADTNKWLTNVFYLVQ